MEDYVMSNMPILYQNIMYGLPSDYARDVFLWAVDKTRDDAGAYKAEKLAREADRMWGGHDQSETHIVNDLMEFIKKRHVNYVLGGNTSGNY